MKRLVVIAVLVLACPAIAFEANSIWLKGDVDLAERKQLDPTVNVDGFEIGNDEPVTLYVTYRSPAIDDRNWSKVSFRVDVLGPNGPLETAEETKKDILAGEGIITDKDRRNWGISRGRISLVFSEEDDRGIYAARIAVRDHVSGEVVRRTTRILLKGLSTISSEKDYEFFTNMYYVDPQPELIPQAIRFVSKSKLLKKHKNAGPPTLGFFAQVFGDNSQSIAQWKKVIRTQDRKTRKLLNRAIDTDIGTLLSQTEIGAGLNDMYWGAFFASGDPRYLNSLIKHLRYLEDRADINRYLAAASAKWSLSTNARRHPQIWRTVEAMKTSNIPKNRALAGDILSMEPKAILDEMIAVLKEQNEKGVWVKRP